MTFPLATFWPEAVGPGFIILGFGGALFLYLVISGIYYAYFHPLSKVPGPKLYTVSQLPYIYHVLRGDWHDVLKACHDKYGPVVRFTYTDVSFTTADAIKKIYGHKSGGDKTFEKDMGFYRPKEHHDIIRADNEEHRRMRRLLSHAFSEKALRNQEDVLKRYSDLFIQKLTEQARKGSMVDIVSWYNFATFDLVGDLAFGQPFGCLESGGYHPWVKMIFEGVKAMAFSQMAARLRLDSLAMLFTPARLKHSFEEHFNLSQQTALKRINSQDIEREDFMSYILRHNDKNGMSVPEIVENSSTLIIAGSETTATLLSGTTFQLLTNPATYDKLVHEIRSAFQSEEEITLTRVNELQYLIAAFNEGFRMYPPLPISLPRITPQGGEFIEGYWIPENTTVSVSHWSTFRTGQNFRDPDRFVPERWLGDPQYINDHKSVLHPFSFGPRNCIGRNLAYAEMRLLMVNLLWRFDLEMLPDDKNWDKQKVFNFWEKGSLRVKLTERARIQ